MASNARIFLAGVGTTFIILGVGFGGGLLMANSAFEQPTGYRSHAPSNRYRQRVSSFHRQQKRRCRRKHRRNRWSGRRRNRLPSLSAPEWAGYDRKTG